MQLKFLLIVVCIYIVSARNGLEVSQPYTDATFSCFAQQTASFVVVQAYISSGNINQYASLNLRTAKSRGFETDIFMNHCNAKNPSSQVNEMTNSLASDLYDTIWVRVEQNSSPGCDWSSNTPQFNCQYLKSLASAIQSKGKKAGIYSTTLGWLDAFQTLTYCPDVSNLPLWYGANDDSASFSSFSSFGGWKTPSLKTYSYGRTMCGSSVNLTWKP